MELTRLEMANLLPLSTKSNRAKNRCGLCFWVWGAAIVLAFLMACGEGSSRTVAEEPQTAIDPVPAMRQAVDQLLALKSAAFTLEHLTGSTELFPGLQMTKASGVVDIPGKFEVKVEAQIAFPKSFLEVSIITIDESAYITDFLSGQWREVSPESLPFSVFALGETLAGIVDQVEGPEFVALAELRGHETYRIQGKIKSEDLAKLVPGAGTGFDVALDLWLDRTNGLLHQVLISGKVVPSDAADAVRELRLDDINLPVEIAAPSLTG